MVGQAKAAAMSADNASAREKLLANVRKALRRAANQPLDQAVPRAALSLLVPRSDHSLYTQLFVQNFESLAGKAFTVPSASEVLPHIAPLIEGKTAVASNAPYLESTGITRLAQVRSGITDRDELREAAAAADIGITSVDYALAETGTFVMLASPREARLISLLPPVHIAIFPRSRILANLGELFSVAPKPADHTSSMVLITGPSRTADIEQILVRGVHGPGEVYAVIVDDE